MKKKRFAIVIVIACICIISILYLYLDEKWQNEQLERISYEFVEALVSLDNDIVLQGLNLNSLQGDKEVIDILERMGCQFVKEEEGYKIECQQLKATDIDASQCPDIIPVIALACASANGTSRIYNAKRLRIKECDRLKATVEVLNCLGIEAKELEEEMIINGGSITGGNVSSYNDHRMAMMEAIASTVSYHNIIIDNKECVKKSYPSFWEHFKKLGGKINEC